MKFKSSVFTLLCNVLLAAFLFGFAQLASAQVNIANLNTYNQNFDGLPLNGTFTDNVTLPGWSVSYTGTKNITAADGNNTTAGLRNFGNNGETDRALGGVTNGTTGDIYFSVRLKNTTGSAISKFIVSYTLEEWRGMQKEPFAPFGSVWWYTSVYGSLAFDYRIGSGSWVPVSGLDVTGAVAGANNADLPVDGNQNKTTLTASIAGALANNSEITFRWRRPNTYTGNYLSIDDVNITPVSGTTNIYYNTYTTNWLGMVTLKDVSLLANWNTSPDGSGTAPATFNNAIFIFDGKGTSHTLANNLVIGTGAKLIIAGGELIVSNNINRKLTGTVDVNDNATLTLNNATLPTLGMLSDWSTVNFNSSSDLPNVDFGNLQIGNGNKKLKANTKVKKKLRLNTKLDLNNYSLTLEDGATIENASTTNYIVAKGSGRLKQKVKNNNQDVLFPVGTDTKYLPVKIRQTNAAVTDNFSVKVIDGVYAAYDAGNNPTGTALTERAINKTWIIDEEVISGSDITLTIPLDLQLLTPADLLTGFDILDRPSISHFENNNWDEVPAGAGAINTINAVLGQYEIVRSNITSFSPFYVKSGTPTPLPVELVSFTAKRAQNGIVCNWKTAQELNNDFFTIERGADGLEFTEAGTVKGQGTTSQASAYSFTDLAAPTALVYYRLKQTDFDGTVSYSKIVGVAAADMVNMAITLYPNPTAGQALLQTAADLNVPAQVSILNAQGQIIKDLIIKSTELRTGYLLDLNAQPNGVYLIKVVTEHKITVHRLVKQ